MEERFKEEFKRIGESDMSEYDKMKAQKEVMIKIELSKRIIFTVTTVPKRNESIHGWKPSSRLVGYFHTLEDATEIVENNYGDIWETIYLYAVIEEVKAGLYPLNSKEHWFEFCREEEKYSPIAKPKEYKQSVGWGIG